MKNVITTVDGSKMIRQFTVFKKDVTTKGPVTILSKYGEPYDRKAKMEFHKSLGYKVVAL